MAATPMNFIQEAERNLGNFRMEEGTAVEWLIQALEGSARREVLTRAAGEADTQSSQPPWATTGASLLCSPRSTAGGREWGRV